MAITLKDSNGKEAIVNEGESFNFQCQLKGVVNGEESNISKTALLTIVATLFDWSSKHILNGWNQNDVLDENGGTVTEDGLVRIAFQKLDNIIKSTSLAVGGHEVHNLRLEWTWDDGTTVEPRDGFAEYSFKVEKKATPIVPSP